MSVAGSAQNLLTPETLWKLGRLSTLGVSKDGKMIVYKVTTPSVEENKSNAKFYSLPIGGGLANEIQELRIKYWQRIFSSQFSNRVF